MFHWQNNTYFGRTEDGSVRILKLSATPKEFPAVSDEYPDAVLDVTVDADSWASVIASVSAGGEAHNRFYAAQKFHSTSGMIDVVHLEELEQSSICSRGAKIGETLGIVP